MDEEFKETVITFMQAVRDADKRKSGELAALRAILTHMIARFSSNAEIAAFRNKIIKSLETAKAGPDENRDIMETVMAQHVHAFFDQFDLRH